MSSKEYQLSDWPQSRTRITADPNEYTAEPNQALYSAVIRTNRDEDGHDNSDFPRLQMPSNFEEEEQDQTDLLDFSAYSRFQAILPSKRRRAVCFAVVVIVLLIVAAIVVTVVLVTRKHHDDETTTMATSPGNV